MSRGFLLDTMVVSEGFKKPPSPAVVRWLDAHSDDPLAVSVITFGEIAAGIEKKRQTDVAAFEQLSAWLADTQEQYASRTLLVTVPVALRWGVMVMQLKRRDTDLLIAATALEHDLTVVTRNVRHFELTGAKVFNPYA